MAKLEVHKVLQTPCRAIARGDGLWLNILQTSPQLFLGQVRKVVAAHLWQQIFCLQQHITNQPPSQEIASNPKSLPLASFGSRHSVLRTTQTPKLLPLSDHLELLKASRQDVKVAGISVVACNDVRVKFLDLGKKRREQMELVVAGLHASLRQCLVSISWKWIDVKPTNCCPCAHSWVLRPGICADVGMKGTRNGQHLMRGLRALLDCLHRQTHHAQWRADSWGRLCQLCLVFFCTRPMKRLRSHSKLLRAVGEPCCFVLEGSGFQAQPARTHDLLGQQDSFQQRGLDTKSMAEGLPVDLTRKSTRSIADDFQEGQVSQTVG
mmetsp:Transcript_48710/g.106083  ORF Transcript_48710/g.106083 Transcript_48710/m.106083 type:complete len:322 (+) Transcript_48710:2159-3124(+)